MAAAWREILAPRFGTRRLALGAIVGIGVGLASGGLMRLPYRIAAGWIVAVAIYLTLTALLLGSAAVMPLAARLRRISSSGLIVSTPGSLRAAVGATGGRSRRS